MRARAIINLDNLLYNINHLLENIPLDRFMAIVKANAYGHGYKQVVELCLKRGITFFGVATYKEACEIYKINKNVRILILGPIEKKEIKNSVSKNFHITITSFEEIEYILSNRLNANVHLAFDTGMGRIGFFEEEIEKAIKLINPIGIFTHLSSAESNDEYTKFQLEKFNNIVKKYDIKYKHALNSHGSVFYYEDYSLYRIGIMLYGGEAVSGFKRVMNLEGRVSFIKKLDKDFNIGYSNTYTAKKGDIIATISIGYADGVNRKLANKGKVYLKGKYYNIVGSVCMDQLMILADDKVKIGDYVEIFGENLDVEVQSEICETILYELFCNVSNRVKRVYVGGNT